MTKLLVVRLKSTSGQKPKIKHTLKLLRLHRIYTASLVDDTPNIRGMLQVVKDVTTYGEITLETLVKLLRKRGRLQGNKRLTDENVEQYTGFKTIEELAKALYENKIKFKDLPALKPVFRLHPPRKGFKSLKRSYNEGGDRGYRAMGTERDMNFLVEKMI